MNLKIKNIDSTWTLFLDRDGVINHKIKNGYVTKVEEFSFLDGVQEAIAIFRQLFGKIIIVTNQQGIGKGLMTEDDLEKVHRYMTSRLAPIDAIYYAPHLAAEQHPDRKPQIGMALKAKKNFPSIDFQKSIMIGDSPSDMKFGKNAGMFSVFIGEKEETVEADLQFDNLLNAAFFFAERKKI